MALAKWINKSWFRGLEAAGEIYPPLSLSGLLALLHQNVLPLWSQTQHHPLDFKVLFPSELMSCVSRDELPPAEATSHLLVYSLDDVINI